MKNQAFWSYVAGAIAGGGSAAGAYLFLHAPDVESGSLCAVASGTVSAWLAFLLAKHKLSKPHKLLCAVGFCIPPAVYFALAMI